MIAPAEVRRLFHSNRPFGLLLASLAVSSCGDWLYNVALLAFVYERTGSATWVALTTTARVLPMLLLGPFGGALADRWDRRRLLLGSDLARAGLIGGLATVVALDGPPAAAPLLAALATAAGIATPPCVAACTARFVPAPERQAANGLRAAIGQAAIVVGPALGAILLALAGPATAIGIDALTFLVSFAAIAAIPAGPAFVPTPGAGDERLGLLGDVVVGARALRGSPVAIRLVAADVVCSAVYGVLTVTLVMVAGRIGVGGSGYGLLLAACGVGGIAGATAVGRVAAARDWRRTLAVALGTVGVGLALLGAAPDIAAALALALLLGTGMVVAEVLSETALPSLLDEEVFARAYGLLLPAAVAGIVAGSLAAGPLVGLLGLSGALAATGLLVLLAAALLLRRRPLSLAPRPVPIALHRRQTRRRVVAAGQDHEQQQGSQLKMRTRLLLLSIAAVALLSAVGNSVADAATITVNSTADGSVPGKCTLRDAIASAVADTPFGSCLGGDGDDTIRFQLAAGSTIALGEGELVLPPSAEGQNITVEGPGADELTISGRMTSRVIHVEHSPHGVKVAISGLTISGGKAVGAGGGLLNEGELTLAGVVVAGDEVNVTGSSTAFANGGGIANAADGSLTLTASTVAGNIARAVLTGGLAYADGGGVFNEGTLTIADSTLADNSAISSGGEGQAAGGGGITTTDGMRVTSSTIVGNSISSGGLRAGANLLGTATTELENTIVADPEGATNCPGPVTSLGYNLEDEDSCGFDQGTDQPETDPKLAAAGLADNGGPTPTIALEPGSPALDQGLAGPGETTDQRGLPRPVVLLGLSAPPGGDHADIGAFEQQAPETTEPGGGGSSGGGGSPSGGGAGSEGGNSPSAGTRPATPTPTPTLKVTIAHLAAKTTSRRLTIRFHADLPGATFRCTLDGARPRPCASPFKTKKLGFGKHTFTVVAIAAGQASKPAKARFRIVPPRVRP
jgi:CSLREA domain-containing protein